MNRKRALILILLLFTSILPLIPIPIAKAYSKTTYIVSDYDDVWMTEAGNVFGGSSMVIMLDESIGLHSFLRFQNVDVARTVKINNATLYVYAGEVQADSPGASVTIYGIDEPDCGPFTVGSGLWSLSRPYTSASVNWNLTSWSMGWHSVDVTNIIEEIINQYAWDTNNSLGFQILGAPDTGHDSRSFEDYHHPYRESQAKLTIVYDVIEEEEEPPGDPEFVEQYGEYTIWRILGIDEITNYIFTEGTEAPYDIMYDTLDGSGPIYIDQSPTTAPETLKQRKLIRTSDGTLYVAYHKYLAGQPQIYVIKSMNNGTTWTDATRISTYAGMASEGQSYPTIAVGSSDNLHVIWKGRASGYDESQIWYALYDGSWHTPVRISTYPGQDNYPQQASIIAIDGNDHLHTVWHGYVTGILKNQIWYALYNGSWQTPIRISDKLDMEDYSNLEAYIAVDSNNYLHAIWQGKDIGYPTLYQIWYNKYTTSWAGPIRISTADNMATNSQSEPTVAIDSNDYLHAIWSGVASDVATNQQVRYALYNGSWQTPIRISDPLDIIDMDGYHQQIASIAVDSSDNLHVLWHGKATGYTDYNKIWYAGSNDSWANPICLQPTGQNKYPNLRWSTWNNPIEGSDDTFIVTDENGTVVDTWTDNDGQNFTDIDDLKDYIDDEIDPGGGDPLDPSPGTQGWPEEGEDHPFTRFKMRLYILFIGLGCVFMPLWAMAYKKFDSVGYTWCFLIMVLGVGLLWSITGI